MLKHSNKDIFLIFFLIITIPSFFFIATIVVSNFSYDLRYEREVPISMTDNEWNKDGGNLYLQSPLNTDVKKWTVMFYIAHDNNLFFWYAFPHVGSNDDLNVIFLEDRNSVDDTRVVYVLEGGGRIYINLSSINPSWIDEVNTGNPDTLSSFVQYCIDNYPAEHYWIVLDNHGGAYRGVCWDWTSGDHLSIGDLKITFSSITSYLGRKIDGVLFDACLMANMEIAAQLSPYVNYMVGGESLIRRTTWDEDEIVNTILPYPSPQDFAIELVNIAKLTNSLINLMEAVAAIKLTIIQELLDDIDNLATQLINIFNIYGKEIRDARKACQDWGDENVDLIDLLEKLYKNIPNQMIRYLVLEILEKLGPSDQYYAIINHRHTESTAFTHGLSIYFPFTLLNYSSSYEIGNDFCALTNWEEFLHVFYENDIDGAITPFGNSYVFFIILGAVPLIIIGGRKVIFKKR